MKNESTCPWCWRCHWHGCCFILQFHVVWKSNVGAILWEVCDKTLYEICFIWIQIKMVSVVEPERPKSHGMSVTDLAWSFLKFAPIECSKHFIHHLLFTTVNQFPFAVWKAWALSLNHKTLFISILSDTSSSSSGSFVECCCPQAPWSECYVKSWDQLHMTKLLWIERLQY